MKVKITYLACIGHILVQAILNNLYTRHMRENWVDLSLNILVVTLNIQLLSVEFLHFIKEKDIHAHTYLVDF